VVFVCVPKHEDLGRALDFMLPSPQGEAKMVPTSRILLWGHQLSGGTILENILLVPISLVLKHPEIFARPNWRIAFMVGGSDGTLNQLGLGRLRGFRLGRRGRTRGLYRRELKFWGIK